MYIPKIFDRIVGTYNRLKVRTYASADKISRFTLTTSWNHHDLLVNILISWGQQLQLE